MTEQDMANALVNLLCESDHEDEPELEGVRVHTFREVMMMSGT